MRGHTRCLKCPHPPLTTLPLCLGCNRGSSRATRWCGFTSRGGHRVVLLPDGRCGQGVSVRDLHCAASLCACCGGRLCVCCSHHYGAHCTVPIHVHAPVPPALPEPPVSPSCTHRLSRSLPSVPAALGARPAGSCASCTACRAVCTGTRWSRGPAPPTCTSRAPCTTLRGRRRTAWRSHRLAEPQACVLVPAVVALPGPCDGTTCFDLRCYAQQQTRLRYTLAWTRDASPDAATSIAWSSSAARSTPL